jgi:ribosomal protein S24E
MTEDSLSNIFLVLIRLDLNSADKTILFPEFRTISNSDKTQLMVGVLDQTQRTTSTPMAAIPFGKGKTKCYNRIIESVQNIQNSFKNYLIRPYKYNKTAQFEIREKMDLIGRGMYDLLNSPHTKPLQQWLDNILKPNEDRTYRKRKREIDRSNFEIKGYKSPPHVTIITNDFSIPWYWLKNEQDGAFLCENCLLGTVQLQGTPFQYDDDEHAEEDFDTYKYKALLINGNKEMPYIEEELNYIKETLTEMGRRSMGSLDFEAELVNSANKLLIMAGREMSELVKNLNIVHYSGHYSKKEFIINGVNVNPHPLRQIIKNSLLVLDGCSSLEGLDAWADDITNLTAYLINKGGALGCLVTPLPIKNDPIVSKVFWGEFYKKIRNGGGITIGKALHSARISLRNHFESFGSENPSWAFYQLIGRPTILLGKEKRIENF